MHVYLDLDGNAYVVYADDSCLWHAASTWEEVKAVLEEKSAKFAVWAKANGLAMNGAKTQLLVSSNAGAAANLSVRVGVNDIACGRDLELLGVRFDRKMSTAPHVEDMAKAAKQRAAMIARLSQHLPRGRYLQQLANGLVLGKVNHALAAVAAPRLKVDTPTMGALRSVQIAVNNAARSVIGSKKSDHVRVEELNEKAGFPSINALVTKAVALEAWTAYTSCDGHGGGRNPLGVAMFDSAGYNKYTRAAAAGRVQNPLRGQNTLVSHAIEVWNVCPPLRAAATRAEARRAALQLARGVPL